MNYTKTKILTALSLLLSMNAGWATSSVFAATPVDDYEEIQLIATAYYSPLPNQSFYLRGSYEGDLRLNGNGTNGASGKEVFIGMLAAPKTYDFGTKIWIEWLGVGSVEDRGGAIVPAGQRGYQHDRVDIWMGSGEPGLRRALKWGKRTVKARIYNSPEIAGPIAFSLPPVPAGATPIKSVAAKTIEPAVVEKSELDAKLEAFRKEEAKIRKKFETIDTPTLGESSQDVRLIQEVLIELGYFDRRSTGIFGEYTIDAIARFQIDHKLVLGKSDPNAGKLWKLTRDKLIFATLLEGIDIEEIAAH